MRAVLNFCAVMLAVSAAGAAEYLPVCEKCLNPRIISKSEAGTSAASAEARVVPEDATAWCATNRPRDPYCAREEVTNGGDGGRKSYRATADCSAGVLQSIDGYEYRYAGTWSEGPGRGRAMLKDTGGNIRRWNSISSGYGVARSEWNQFGGYSLTGQWEVLCGSKAPAVAAQANPPAAPATASQPAKPASNASGGAAEPQRAATPAAAVCTGKRYCEETNTFAAIVRDFRPSTISNSTRIVSATLKFLNKTNRPLILGYVRSAGVAVDEQGNRYTLASADSVRGIGEIAGRDFDPKFTLAPGQTMDARFEFSWRWNGRDILGQKAWDVELALREVSEVVPGQYRYGAEHAIQFRGVPAAPVAMSGKANSADATAATIAEARTEPVPETRRTDACAGKLRCFDGGNFVAEIQHASLTHEGTYQDRVARLNVTIRNTGQQPVSLAYVAKSSVLTDNLGNRFFWGAAGTYDMSAQGIGKVESNRADPQLTLAPGESRMATFTLRRRTAKTDPDGAGYTYNMTLAELQVINPQQVRTAREHSLSFTDFPLNSSAVAGAAAPPAAPAQSTNQSIRDLSNAIRGLGRKK